MRPVEASSGSRGYEAVLGDDLNLFDYPAGDYSIRLVSGAQVENSFGDSRPIQDEVASLLGDGEVTSTSRYGNKELVFCVEVSATDHAGLAAGEARLMDELDRVNTLTWAGPVGPRSVFEIVRSWSDFLFEDLEDVRCRRQYRVTLEVLPFVRSEKPVTFTWSGPTRTLPLTVADWVLIQTVPSGPTALANYDYGEDVGIRVGAGTARTVTIESAEPVLIDGFFIHLVKRYAVGSQADPLVSIGGESINLADGWVQVNGTGITTEQTVYDVSKWRGTYQTIRIQFRDTGATNGYDAGLNRVCWSNYPNPIYLDGEELDPTGRSTYKPLGIDSIPILGTARTGLLVEFDAPVGVGESFQVVTYTAPDPRRALRDKGAPEAGWGSKNVTNPDGEVITYDGIDTYLSPGLTRGVLFTTSGQPPVLNPNGIWPEFRPYRPQGANFGYPADDEAAVSSTFITETTSVTVLSPSVDYPSGLTSGGEFLAHEPHLLHPSWSGFGVFKTSGTPVTCTVTYYPRWRHHAAV